MSWMGKLLGGGLGFMIGGPIGAVVGAVLGHHTLDSGAALSFEEQRQGIFFIATFSMLGKLSKADGVVSQEEIEAIEAVTGQKGEAFSIKKVETVFFDSNKAVAHAA